jgi:hypothetical protein
MPLSLGSVSPAVRPGRCCAAAGASSVVVDEDVDGALLEDRLGRVTLPVA